MTTLTKLGQIILVAMVACVPALILAQTASQLTITTSSKEALAALRAGARIRRERGKRERAAIAR